jgi:hypothetical protein
VTTWYSSSVIVTVAATLLCAASATAQTQARSAVPIREVVIRPEGTSRYVVTITVNGVAMDAGIDTGSLGLRLTPHGVTRSGVVPSGAGYAEGYGSGVELRGPDVPAVVQIGTQRGSIRVQATRTVACKGNARCAAPSSDDPHGQDAFGIMGLGHPGQGFPAILGIRLQPGRIDHPLVALGARRWIVHLPARGGVGALILNPDAQDTAGFVPLQLADKPIGGVRGCVMAVRPGARQICGGIIWDTGASSIHVKGAQRPPALQPGAAAEMMFTPADDTRPPRLGFEVDDRAHGGEVSVTPDRNEPHPLILGGTLPFYAYDMLFDADGHIAIRPNADQRGLPRAIR